MPSASASSPSRTRCCSTPRGTPTSGRRARRSPIAPWRAAQRPARPGRGSARGRAGAAGAGRRRRRCGRAARCCATRPMPASRRSAEHPGESLGQQRLQAGHRGARGGVVLPDDAARARGVAHVQRAVRASTENTGPDCAGRATPSSSVRAGNGHRVGRHQRAHMVAGRRRAARCRRSRGRAARFTPPWRAGRTQCRIMPRMRAPAGW